jgi:Flavodoxin domain
MKAVVLIESLTGNTRKAGEMIASKLQQEHWGITDVCAVRRPDHAAIQEADMVIVGTWVHGLFVVGQAPWGAGALQALPAMAGKQAAAFCTFALSPARSLDRMTRILEGRGAAVVGGLALNRGKLEAHTDTFVDRLLGAVTTT